MDNIFSLLGKALVVVGVIGILVGGGYYLGTRFNKPTSSVETTAVSPTSTVSHTLEVTSPTPTVSQHDNTGRFAVQGGGASTTVYANVKYTLSGVAGWTSSTIVQPGINTIKLTKGDYQLTITQAAMGGGGCTFPGDQPQDMSVALNVPVANITLLDGTLLKRGQADPNNNPGKETFDVCQKEQGNTYGNLTTFGVINYLTPLNPDSEVLAEMDAMVGSLQK